jgi:hypothetical protein
MAKSALVPSGVQSRIQNPESSVQLRALRALWISVLSGGQAAIQSKNCSQYYWILILGFCIFTGCTWFFLPR